MYIYIHTHMCKRLQIIELGPIFQPTAGRITEYWTPLDVLFDQWT